ncbi:hypothetical protein NCLIV_035610 [Neospora caninum Liverpool]|uniref:cAMP-dependent protein kinase A anchor protein, AKAP7 n=1 Tax=Neospora caninum (strain Liverpool) TaxID=572307 RepID=F0VJ69_NEOCL|nr:hypothetical protein NCLIV_035610 [Neospora caninum Liverpool]CBZ53780.1 hypothetical protein NCLIV_035610 [Neospora caninum Liverpool]CEL67773.1 TPA: cAMP-dependent protein kinase A anchor protein, AKAP7 [Neospora caninum Liverpool]|eukprot:XP_003883812.1 hypothetical protein NCLIV_035610 [Neospora caninum Liverpool]
MSAFEGLPEAFLRPQFRQAKVAGCTYRQIEVDDGSRDLFDLPLWDQNDNLHKWQRKKGGDTGDGGDNEAHVRHWEAEDDYLDEEASLLTFDDSSSSWTLHMSIPRALHHAVVGKRGQKLRELERDFHVSIQMPSANEEEVTIQGSQRDSLLSVKAEIELLLEQQKPARRYSHFICIPLTDPRLGERFNIFKAQLKAAYPDLDEALFAQPNRLHFTILMLNLPTKESEETCRHFLESLGPRIYDAVDTRCMRLHLKGLEILNDDPSSAHVVYTTQYSGNDADQETLDRLNRLCEAVIVAFKEAGIVTDEELRRQRLVDSEGKKCSVKLHATVMNTTYQIRKARRSRPDAENEDSSSALERRREAIRHARGGFDATQLLRDFRLFDFLNAQATCVSLCSLTGSEEQGGFYRTVASVRLP